MSVGQPYHGAQPEPDASNNDVVETNFLASAHNTKIVAPNPVGGAVQTDILRLDAYFLPSVPGVIAEMVDDKLSFHHFREAYIAKNKVAYDSVVDILHRRYDDIDKAIYIANSLLAKAALSSGRVVKIGVVKRSLNCFGHLSTCALFSKTRLEAADNGSGVPIIPVPTVPAFDGAAAQHPPDHDRELVPLR